MPLQVEKISVTRFEAKYIPEPNTGCWLWIAALDRHGYGAFGVALETHRAHRVSFLLARGWLPDNLDHRCRVRHCVNPDHLAPISRGDNVLLGEAPTAINKRKTECIHGHPFDEANTGPTSKLKPHLRRCRTCHRLNEMKRKERNRV